MKLPECREIDKRLTIAHGKYHTDQSRAHAYYILRYTLFHFLSFSSFVDCRVRVRVSSRARESVSFIFLLHFSPFRCMLKDRKLQPLQVPPPWHSGYGVRTVLIESRVRFESRACYYFLRLLKSSLSKLSVMVSFSLNITFRVRVNFNMRHL